MGGGGKVSRSTCMAPEVKNLRWNQFSDVFAKRLSFQVARFFGDFLDNLKFIEIIVNRISEILYFFYRIGSWSQSYQTLFFFVF